MNKIIKFEQPNCSPCKMVSQHLEMHGVEYEAVDAFDNAELSAQFGVMSVPVTVLVDDSGSEIKRSIGYKPAELDDIINSL